MRIRRQRSHAAVKALHSRLQQAYQRDDGRLVRRPTVWIDLLVPHEPMAVRCERWGRSLSCLSDWPQALVLRGMHSLVSPQSGGRPSTLTPQPKKRLGERMEAGPLGVGCETACWPSVLIRVLRWRAGGVLDNCQYGCTLRPHLGCAWPKARGVSDPLDAARRQHGLQQEGPTMRRGAERRQGLILFADAASVAPGGSLSSTGARRGQPPAVTTSGTRKGDNVFGALESCSGRLGSQGIEGRLTSDSSQGFWHTLLAHTTAHLWLRHEGARDHTRQATPHCLAAHRERLTASPLPSSAPDAHPMAYRWQKTKKRATHHQYFKALAALTGSVDKALAYCATHPAMV